MVKVTSLIVKAGSGLRFSFGVRAWTEMEIRCVKGMHRLKLASCENNCRAQQSGARLGNRDVAPVARCSLGPENVKCMSRFWHT